MGKRGPQAAPAPLRLLKGNGIDKDIAGRPVSRGPAFERGAPEPPAWFSRKDPTDPNKVIETAALQEWNRVVDSLEPLDLLKAGDYAALTAHCETWATYLIALARVRKEGITLVHPVSQKVYKNPAQTVLETAATQLRNSCREFGLTPASEQSLASGTAAVERDEFDPFSESG